MRGGWTVNAEHLTYDGREPDAYDWQADEVDPIVRWVLRRYDEIVWSLPTRNVHGTFDPEKPTDEFLHKVIHEYGVSGWSGFDNGPDWHEFSLYAEELSARFTRGQTETLPLAV